MARKVFKYKRVSFWAEDGMVQTYDDRDGSFKEHAPMEFMARGHNFGDEEAAVEMYHDEAHRLKMLANDIQACVDQALRQGDPTNPKVQAQMANLSSRRVVNMGVALGSAMAAAPRPHRSIIVPGERPARAQPKLTIMGS